MRKQADVRAIDSLREAKVAIVEFREVAGVALSEAKTEVQRALWWVQNDRRQHWEREIKRRTEMIAQARSDLERARFAAMDSTATCVDESRAVERAQRAVEEARRKLEAVKQWSHKLEREMLLFRGKCQGLARAVDGDLPRAEAKLDLLHEQLESYIRLAAPAAPAPPRAKPPSEEKDA